ncbi:UDP-4-amino-4,6-dideoxy-N-acetyl-beta-L-altrosamine transaminase [Oleidesulfovibrio alaskensis]|jgi:perosamine synthetase|uniref:UDP-4-amino-4, 6-dideoxy-N-acetyl-beta-L-altrosamine transaminase n=1 Tax=Oleidesulfovibrio alaskensis TaxID=58180 RepID=UPI00040DBD42|nr:UDP-4-amino-4,6-dideoxy-N-acetyl-beta-L-altrosamine transaminase [Oleidesulfovibrio alaskensis]
MSSFLPYGRQIISEDDIEAVVGVLRGDWLTTGPAVRDFEQAFAAHVCGGLGVAVNSGTAALHCAYHALGVTAGDEVIVPAMTFAATANAVLHCGARPVFADVCPRTLLIDPESAERCITPRTKVLVGVDYAGHPCDWDALRTLADRYSLRLVADACHAAGARYKGRPVGSIADISVFSFHPVKHITTAEGGMAVTADPDWAHAMRVFRNHGITTDSHQREKASAWQYDMVELGYNYRLSDLQCALGMSQLARLDDWVAKRNILAACYRQRLAGKNLELPACSADVLHAYHLFVVFCDGRDALFRMMRKAQIGVNVHYKPVYMHPYYRKNGYAETCCPVAEAAYERLLTLPMWAGMSEEDVQRVCALCQPV